MTALPGTVNVERMMVALEERARRQWGRAFELLGPDLVDAILSREVLILAASQDDSVGDDVVRQILTGGRSWVIDRVEELRQ